MSTQAHDPMEQHHPMEEKRQCTAKSKQSGQRCRRPPIIGGMVCVMHGGKAPQVRRQAAKRLRDLLGEAIDPNCALREAARVAYSDIRDAYGKDGKLLHPKDWPEDFARAVASHESEEITGNVDKGDGQLDRIVKTRIRLWDKNHAAERLFKHLGLLKESLSLTGAIEIRWKGQQPQGMVVEGEKVGQDVTDTTALALSDGKQSK